MPRIIADLQIHSKYARAVSPKMVLEELDRWASDKGINVMGTGDFTHPSWFAEIKEKLEPAEQGLYKLKAEYKLPNMKGALADTRFMLTSEISNVYTRHGRGRRVHNLIWAPSIAAVEKLNTALSWVGNLKSDGRPILGLDSEELVKMCLEADADIVVIPAHAWTPWFAVFGSMSGFDTLEECYGEHTKYIFAVETGLSSDPVMNWRLSQLDNVAIVSNSDSHSLEKIGREANAFDCELSYNGIIKAIKSSVPAAKKDPKNKFLYTIEFFPEEGKYHYDGHRLCGVSWTPQETKKHGGICTACGRKVTIGVMNRMDALADRPLGYADARRTPYKSIVPLHEVIRGALGCGKTSKKIPEMYMSLIKAFGPEFGILLDIPVAEIAVNFPRIAEAVDRVRRGDITIVAGYDGEFGHVSIFPPSPSQK
ncbi:MAG: DNA helicase UvrD [Candidatus Pacebacteria bacterium]|nr:DNA helicase UvrD [Candidatus Paceibacterota bacterium]